MTSTQSDSSSFGQLDERIQRWIWQQGWHELRSGQEQLIPLLLEGKYDVILAAPTAAGKTEAAFLPILTKLGANPFPSLGSLYISPLKALINDQFQRLDSFSEILNIDVHRWHGDVSQSAKQRLLTSPSGILLITPESLEALFVNQGAKLNNLCAHLQYVVIDELHALLDNERGAQLRSLLHRLDNLINRKPVRVGLSATLADMHPAAQFLRGDDPANVKCVVTNEPGVKKAVIKAFVNPEAQTTKPPPARDQVVFDLYTQLKSEHHLVFANARNRVEEYADALRERARLELLSDIFLAHHGNLSKELREEAEMRLRDDPRPAVCVCTSTLELGIDIGAMKSVAQIGPPPSVTSLRQRVGRSGRRGEPSILRMYALENPGPELMDPSDQLRPELLREIAGLELMLENWYEPPRLNVPHYSTLVQQVLSSIIQHGGASIAQLFRTLCGPAAFSTVTKDDLVLLLRALRARNLILQMDDGTLLLDKKGERITSHYSFYAAFETPEEYRLIHGSKTLGTIPVESLLRVNDHVLFAGKRWRVIDISDEDHIILVEPSRGARAPQFIGTVGKIHARVRHRMREVLERADQPHFLSETAQQLLTEAREAYARLNLSHLTTLEYGQETLLFHWSGDAEAQTLSLMLADRGIDAGLGELTFTVQASLNRTLEALVDIVEASDHPESDLLQHVKLKRQNKYDWALPPDLLDKEYAAREFDVPGAVHLARQLLGAEQRDQIAPTVTVPTRRSAGAPSLEVLDGYQSIGGTKILLSQRGEDILLDFGLDFKRYANFFEEFLRPRSTRGLLDLWHFQLVPHFNGLYRDDLRPLGELFPADREANVVGILLSHAHVDHYGMIGTLRPDIPLHATPESLAIIKSSQDTGRVDFWGEAVYAKLRGPADRDSRALRVQDGKLGRPTISIGPATEALSHFLASLPSDEGTRNLVPGALSVSTGQVGSFSYQAWPVDHSLLGCVAFQVESDLGRIVYTGDFRRHGALGSSTEAFVNEAAKNAPDILICEGTQVMRDNPNTTSETQVKDAANDIVRNATGKLVIADFGPRHIERLNAFHDVAAENQRRLVITTKDAYLLKALAFVNPTITLLDSPRLVIYDEIRASCSKWEAGIKDEFSDKLIDSREIRDNQAWYILAFSFFDCNELVDVLPQEAVYIYSSSEAYSEDQVLDMRRLWAWCNDEFRMKVHGLAMDGDKPIFPDRLNASGHATRQDIEWLIESIRPKGILPVHRSPESDAWFADLAKRHSIDLVPSKCSS
ncbi:MAG TPA: DEAD/DEAH box helicase [Fimbriimonadaceae bacterium]|jgi:ATP-dependent Lhr-like helicase